MLSAPWWPSRTGAHVAHQVSAAWPGAVTPGEQEVWEATGGEFPPSSSRTTLPQCPAWEAVSHDVEGTPRHLPGLPVNS